MEEKTEIIVFRCIECGKEWDDDGCRVSVVSGVVYEVEEFVCDDCEKWEEEVERMELLQAYEVAAARVLG